jgi:uncharacterized protein
MNEQRTTSLTGDDRPFRPEKPWYRHVWPWLVMAPPLASVIAGVAMAWIAIASNDGLVTPDYYREGIDINHRLAREQWANCAVKDRTCLSGPMDGRR